MEISKGDRHEISPQFSVAIRYQQTRQFSNPDDWRRQGHHAMFDLLVMRISNFPVTWRTVRSAAARFG
jgi:hypothetical protein